MARVTNGNNFKMLVGRADFYPFCLIPHGINQDLKDNLCSEETFKYNISGLVSLTRIAAVADAVRKELGVEDGNSNVILYYVHSKKW